MLSQQSFKSFETGANGLCLEECVDVRVIACNSCLTAVGTATITVLLALILGLSLNLFPTCCRTLPRYLASDGYPYCPV